MLFSFCFVVNGFTLWYTPETGFRSRKRQVFLHFSPKTCLNPCEDKTFLAILWISQQLLSFLLVSVTTLHRQKPHFVRNFNIGLIGSCLHPLEKNKSSTLNKKALNKKGFVYLYGSLLCAIFASVIILWISIGHTRNAFLCISHLKPPDSPLTPVC